MTLPKIQQPVYDVVIPSTKKKIKLRPMLVREEKILLIAKASGERSDVMEAVKQIVNNCIVTEGITVEKLAIFDVEYLFIKIRAISVSNIAKVSYRDSEDDLVYDFEVDLDKLEINVDKTVSNTVTVNKDISIELGYPTIELYADKQLYETSEEQMFNMLVDQCLVKVYQGDQAFDPRTSTPEERNEFIESLPVKAAEEIRAFFGSMPSLYHEITYKNSKGTERKIVLNSLDDFFTL